MHADYHGSASTILKNHTKVPIPQASIEEAAISAACRCKAWESKILPSAWWVNADQVSKSAPTGEFLPAGSFMIRGKKNFINPARMEMGLAILFKIDESCLEHHTNDRKPKYLEADDSNIAIDEVFLKKDPSLLSVLVITFFSNIIFLENIDVKI